MFKFFDVIFEFLHIVVGYVISSFSMLGTVFRVIGYAVSFPFRYILALPSSVVALVTVFVSYCVIMNLINKGS